MARRIGVALALIVLSLPAAPGVAKAKPYEPTLVVRWADEALASIRTTRPGPPMTARALAIVHTAMYDAWAAYTPKAVGTRLGAALRRPANERRPHMKEEAISFAAYRALVDLYPGRVGTFDDLMGDLGYDPTITTTDPSTAAGVGNAAAQALLEYRHADGANQANGYADTSGYAPVNAPDAVVDPNRWQPLRLPSGAVQTYVAPHWGQVIPFALSSGSDLRPPPPAMFGTGAYQQQVDDVVAMSAALTDRDKAIVEYWADGPNTELPPGHWCLFARFVSERDRHDVDDDVKMYFALTNALFDASIAAWDAKRAYDYVRPITAVRELYRGVDIVAWGGPGHGTRVIDGGTWLPYQPATSPTPPFAEYVSGHSTFSAAAAEILKRFTGGDRFEASITVPVGSSRVEPGLVPSAPVTLAWPTFSSAADEAGLSRRLGGIHFAQADLEARSMGREIGALTYARAASYWKP